MDTLRRVINVIRRGGKTQEQKLDVLKISQKDYDLIAKFKIANESEFRNLITDFRSITKIEFGHKNQPYFTEKELLKGYSPPKISELSKEEKRLLKSPLLKEDSIYSY